MDIKVGVKGYETLFHYVNIKRRENKSRSEHMTLAGSIKTQESPNVYQAYSIIWLVLTKAQMNELLGILRSSALLNLQLEDEDYVDHQVKFRSPITHDYSKDYPTYYEVIASCVEVE